MSRAVDCKQVTVRGKKRKLCWGMKRIPARMALVIVSNTSPSGYKKKAKKKAAKRRSR